MPPFLMKNSLSVSVSIILSTLLYFLLRDYWIYEVDQFYLIWATTLSLLLFHNVLEQLTRLVEIRKTEFKNDTPDEHAIVLNRLELCYFLLRGMASLGYVSIILFMIYPLTSQSFFIFLIVNIVIIVIAYILSTKAKTYKKEAELIFIEVFVEKLRQNVEETPYLTRGRKDFYLDKLTGNINVITYLEVIERFAREEKERIEFLQDE